MHSGDMSELVTVDLSEVEKETLLQVMQRAKVWRSCGFIGKVGSDWNVLQVGSRGEGDSSFETNNDTIRDFPKVMYKQSGNFQEGECTCTRKVELWGYLPP